jgi:hypothetical protein
MATSVIFKTKRPKNLIESKKKNVGGWNKKKSLKNDKKKTSEPGLISQTCNLLKSRQKLN